MSRHLETEEWRAILIGPSQGLRRDELDDLIQIWKRVTDTKPEAFFEFASDSVRAKNWVGMLATDDVTLQVLPRAGLALRPDQRRVLDRNLNHMLESALSGAIESGSVRISGEGSRYDAAVRALSDATLEALRARRPRRYRSRSQDAPSVRGRLHPLKTDLLQSRRPGLVASTWIELDEDAPELRFIKAVMESARSRVSLPTRRQADLVLAELDRVSLSSNPRSELSAIYRPRLGNRWARAVAIAEDILNGRVGGLFAGSVTGDAEIVYVPTVFERYVALGLSVALAAHGITVRRQQTYPIGLWISGPFQSVEAVDITTDIELRAANETPVMVLDTKWKQLRLTTPTLGVESSDVQQVIAYGHRLRCHSVALVYPWMDRRPLFDEPPILRVGQAAESVDVCLYTLPLLADNLPSALEELAAALAKQGHRRMT